MLLDGKVKRRRFSLKNMAPYIKKWFVAVRSAGRETTSSGSRPSDLPYLAEILRTPLTAHPNFNKFCFKLETDDSNFCVTGAM